jgi:hypothetical protein
MFVEDVFKTCAAHGLALSIHEQLGRARQAP